MWLGTAQVPAHREASASRSELAMGGPQVCLLQKDCMSYVLDWGCRPDGPQTKVPISAKYDKKLPSILAD